MDIGTLPLTELQPSLRFLLPFHALTFPLRTQFCGTSAPGTELFCHSKKLPCATPLGVTPHPPLQPLETTDELSMDFFFLRVVYTPSGAGQSGSGFVHAYALGIHPSGASGCQAAPYFFGTVYLPLQGRGLSPFLDPWLPGACRLSTVHPAAGPWAVNPPPASTFRSAASMDLALCPAPRPHSLAQPRWVSTHLSDGVGGKQGSETSSVSNLAVSRGALHAPEGSRAHPLAPVPSHSPRRTLPAPAPGWPRMETAFGGRCHPC